jgi:thioredoxin 1
MIDADANPSLITKYQVQGIPAFLLFKNGEVKWRYSGLITKEELKNVIVNQQ